MNDRCSRQAATKWRAEKWIEGASVTYSHGTPCISPSWLVFRVFSKDFVRLSLSLPLSLSLSRRSNRYTCTNAASSFVHFFHVTAAEKEGRPNQYLTHRLFMIVDVQRHTPLPAEVRCSPSIEEERLLEIARSTEYLIIPLHDSSRELETLHTRPDSEQPPIRLHPTTKQGQHPDKLTAASWLTVNSPQNWTSVAYRHRFQTINIPCPPPQIV